MSSSIDHLIVTLIPAGRAPNGNARVSLHLSPRIGTGSMALGVKEWLKIWNVGFYEQINIELNLSFRDSEPWDQERYTISATNLEYVYGYSRFSHDLVRRLADSSWSSSGFDRASFKQQFAAAHFRSFPTLELHDFHLDLLSSLLLDHESSAPSPDAMKARLGSLADIDNTGRVAAINEQLGAEADRSADQLNALGPLGEIRFLRSGVNRPYADMPQAPLADHLQVLSFLQPRTSDETTFDPVARPQRDINDLFSLLADHPTLLRMLGLVIDYEIRPRDLPESVLSNLKWIQFLDGPSFPRPYPSVTVFPWVRLDPVSFLAMPRQPNLVDSERFMILNSDAAGEGAWGVVALDVESSAVKAVNMAKTVANAVAIAPGASHRPTTIDPPAPRSGGLRLVRSGRAGDVAKAFQRTATLLEGDPPGIGPYDPWLNEPPMYLEDLVRGYRVDVFSSATGYWHSLTRRNRTYTFDEVQLPTLGSVPGLTVVDDDVDGPVADTGYQYSTEATVSLGVTATADRNPAQNDVFVQQTFFEWSGWSLAVPRPGKSLVDDDTLADSDTGDEASEVLPASELSLDFVTSVPTGSLPRLRYGTGYRFRLRTADLAGNGPTIVGDDERRAWTSADADRSTPEVRYTRFEPVPPPVVALQAPLSPGETLTHLVVRSDDESTDPSTVSSCTRHLLAPSATAATAELHGMFDDQAPAASYALLVARDGKRLAVGPSPAWMAAEGVAYTGVADPASDPADPVPYFADPVVLAPWLVDPVARGFRLADSTGQSIQLVDFDPAIAGDWANRRAWRVSLVPKPIDTAPQLVLDVTTRTLQVWVGAGRRVSLDLSCTVDPTLLDHLAGTDLLRRRNPSNLVDRLARLVNGANRNVTPRTAITFTHAVLTPLLAPEVKPDGLLVRRAANSTSATFEGLVHCDRPSTGSLDFRLVWTDPVDLDPTGATTSTSSVSATQVDVPYPEAGTDPTEQPVRDVVALFGDTKHHLVSITASAATRYGTHFMVTETGSIDQLGFPLQGSDPSTVRVIDRRTGQVLQRGSDFEVEGDNLVAMPGGAEFNDVTVQRVRAGTTRTGTTSRWVHVPASAPPAAPTVRDVVPLFDDQPWSDYTGPSGSGKRRTRDGRLLRIYLDRPWFSSGADEMLAVVLHRGSTDVGVVAQGGVGSSPFNPLQQVTSAWGRDPLVNGSAAASFLTADAFPLAVSNPVGSTWPVVGSPPVIAVPHQVEFDRETGRWFADIAIRIADTYRPFVRLALARYQYYALPGMELSPVALLDAAQLSPTRTLTVTGSRLLRTVTMTGPAYTAGTTGVPRSTAPESPDLVKGPLVQVQVQVRNQRSAVFSSDPDLGWEDVPNRLYTMSPDGFTPGAGFHFRVTDVDVSTRAGQSCRLLIREYERDSRKGTVGHRQRLAFADSFIVS